ncbi:hypothetical protein HK103_001534, partial [Boothiomyces macroporosus]
MFNLKSIVSALALSAVALSATVPAQEPSLAIRDNLAGTSHPTIAKRSAKKAGRRTGKAKAPKTSKPPKAPSKPKTGKTGKSRPDATTIIDGIGTAVGAAGVGVDIANTVKGNSGANSAGAAPSTAQPDGAAPATNSTVPDSTLTRRTVRVGKAGKRPKTSTGKPKTSTS